MEGKSETKIRGNWYTFLDLTWQRQKCSENQNRFKWREKQKQNIYEEKTRRERERKRKANPKQKYRGDQYNFLDLMWRRRKGSPLRAQRSHVRQNITEVSRFTRAQESDEGERRLNLRILPYLSFSPLLFSPLFLSFSSRLPVLCSLLLLLSFCRPPRIFFFLSF